MSEITSGKIPRGATASRQEIAAAVQGLSKADRLRLKNIANRYVIGLGRMAQGRSAGDLLQDAITRTLEEKRRWYKDRVDFVRHLAEAMRSIASHWGEAAAPEEYTESDLSTGSTDPPSLLENWPSPSPDPEQEAIASESLSEIYGFFENDEELWQIILHHAEGRRAAEIQQEMGISPLQYQAAYKRMRRKIAKFMSTRGRHD